MARLIATLLPDQPEAHGLLALLLHSDARSAARRDDHGRFAGDLDGDVDDALVSALETRRLPACTPAVAAGSVADHLLHPPRPTSHQRDPREAQTRNGGMQPSQPNPLLTETQLRPARQDDVPAIAAVWESGWSDGHRGHVPVELEAHRTTSAFARLAERRIANAVLAVDNGVVVGFIVVADDELEQLYVGSSHRGHGVADLLIRHAESIIGERYAMCWLAVASGNARARRFYERSGWIDAGPLEYRAEIDGGHVNVPTHRYEKQIACVDAELARGV